MINKAILVGRITKDPTLHKTQSGTSVVSFTLAVNRRVKDQEQQADFINCVAWNKTADLMHQYVKKGAPLGIEGRIQTRNYDGSDGKKVYVTEVVAESVQFLETKGSAQSNGNEHTGEYSPQTETSDTGYANEDMSMINNDDLPF